MTHSAPGTEAPGGLSGDRMFHAVITRSSPSTDSAVGQYAAARRGTTDHRTGRQQEIALGSSADVDKGGGGGRAQGVRRMVGEHQEDRLDVLQAILDQYQKRTKDLADAVPHEGDGRTAVPDRRPQVMMGLGHLSTAIDITKNFPASKKRGGPCEWSKGAGRR